MSSSESSADSPSPPQSPETSIHIQGPPGLERLVIHFVSAKRSLTSTSHIYRANELVTSSRALIEEIAVLSATNAFARCGLDEQVDTLDAVRDAMVDDRDQMSDEFNSTLAALDQAHERLEGTLASLRETRVDPSLQASKDSHSERDSGSEPDGSDLESKEVKTLYDFIDESSREDLLTSLRSLIDTYHFASSGLDDNLHRYDDMLREITHTLAGRVESPGPSNKPTIYDEPPPSITQLFRSMEEHATEMASLLHNLVNHYDLCVTALRHTEGGSEAARQAALAEDLIRGASGVEESLYRHPGADPISDEERMELLNVLEKDTLEVEDVIVEIKDRAAEMDDLYQQLSRHASKARRGNKSLRNVLNLMHQVRAVVPSQMQAIRAFHESWLDIKSSMESKTSELDGLSDFYDQFLSGYGKLLREAERRKASDVQMQKVADKARRDIDRLYSLDKAAREEFIEDVGQYLPVDIWHGLTQKSTRWEIRPLLPPATESS